jgi:small subunit ribosomal protein S1
MSEERFEDLFNEKQVSAPKLKPGDRIEAKIAGLSGESIFLDIGGKSEGILAASELTDQEGNITVEAGDTVKVFFLANRDGSMVFTTKVGAGQASMQELEDAFHSGIPVQGRVTSEIKGGFQVTVAGQRGFCPFSQMDVRRVEDKELYLDNLFQFKIIEFSSNGRNMILSARAVLEEEREQQREVLMDSLEEGARIKGIVTSIREFGAFVDIGGVDGLIPISELAWGQVDRVEDFLSQGQQVEVIVRKLDWENDRISLSLKETLENPWDKAIEKYIVGSTHSGKVCRLAQFGAFVTLEPGIDGLLHISKLGAGRKIHHPREVVEEGQEITIRIDNVDKEQKRISLVPEDFTEESGSNGEKEEAYKPPVENKSFGTLADLFSASQNKKK